MSNTARDIRISTTYLPGYGGPESWTVTAIDWVSNRLLEKAPAYSDREAGKIEARMEARWIRGWDETEWAAIVQRAKGASLPCSNCGGHTLDDGVCMMGDKVFCGMCDKAGAVEAERAKIEARQQEVTQQIERQRVETNAAAAVAVAEAETGFHWRDGWYARRLDDGAVALCQTEAAPTHLGRARWVRTSLRIPAREWASIVASVSARGETAQVYDAALTLHQTPPSDD